MRMNERLEECRAALSGARRRGLGFLEAYGPDPILAPEVQRRLAPVWEHGRVVLGCIVKANARLYMAGDDSLLGYLIFHPGDEFVAAPRHLRFLAFWARRYAPAEADSAAARLAEIVADDYAFVSNERIPGRLAFGYEVYYTRALLLRAAFPCRRIEDPLVPLLIWPEGSPDCCVLPGRLWARGAWEGSGGPDGCAMPGLESPPWRSPPAPDVAYPQDPDYQWERLRGVRGQPPRLTRRALEGVRRTFREQGFDPSEWFVWLTIEDDADGGERRRIVRFRRFGAPPPRGCHCVQDGITLVWHPDHAALFDGCVIQLEDNWMVGHWYRVADPPHDPTPVVWIRLPGIASIEERVQRVEDPVAGFLETNRLGLVVDSGIMWKGNRGPTAELAEAYIGIETTIPERLVAALLPFLARLALPAGGQLEWNENRFDVPPHPPPG